LRRELMAVFFGFGLELTPNTTSSFLDFESIKKAACCEFNHATSGFFMGEFYSASTTAILRVSPLPIASKS